jgi:hypothetical protein
MDIRRQNAESVARKYIRADVNLKALGSGVEGFVFQSSDSTALKVFTHVEKFNIELAAYQRLHARGIIEVLGFAIPRLVNFDPNLLVIEMTIVQPPFLLDFARARLDSPHDFVEEQEEAWWEQIQANFGDRFQVAQDVFYALQRISGIYYYDLAPRNMNFGDPSP